jgi:mannose-6-phosphate isomerase-like protein (cupin superfamily)
MQCPGFKIKELIIEPGGRLSLQSHKHRTEHWVVVEGTATITRGDHVEPLRTNQSTYIAAGQIHRLENCTENMLRVIEVQCGALLSEDDIERHDDLPT